ncbi:MAG: flagellar hook-basal body complex protein FliE [Pseudomonadota bacterium]
MSMIDMNADAVAQLYASAKPATRPAPAEGADGNGGVSFAEMAGDFLRAMKSAEDTAAAGLTGNADPQAVVEALAATEVAVQAAVVVRDRVVEAYQEILRMPV